MNTFNDHWQRPEAAPDGARDHPHAHGRGDDGVSEAPAKHSVMGAEQASELLRDPYGIGEDRRVTGSRGRGRRVAWVRPSTLLSDGTARLAGRGLNVGTGLNRRTHTWAANRLTPTVERGQDAAAGLKTAAARLAPLSAFGKRSAERTAVSRSGLER